MLNPLTLDGAALVEGVEEAETVEVEDAVFALEVGTLAVGLAVDEPVELAAATGIGRVGLAVGEVRLSLVVGRVGRVPVLVFETLADVAPPVFGAAVRGGATNRADGDAGRDDGVFAATVDGVVDGVEVDGEEDGGREVPFEVEAVLTVFGVDVDEAGALVPATVGVRRRASCNSD